jgi:hypothetical protein
VSRHGRGESVSAVRRRGAENSGLGWKPGRGTAPEKFLLRDAPPPPADEREKLWWMSGWWGDQGETSQCVIYSWLHVLHDGPVTPKRAKTRKTLPKPLADPDALYLEAQKIDGTPSWDIHSGLTCNAGAQVMKRHGWIGEYRWAETVDEIVNYLLTTGPMVIGAWWPESWFDIDLSGKAPEIDDYAGGHQWVLNGAECDEERIRSKNSWGRGFARGGCFDITFRQLDQMLVDGAEVCVFRELPITV